MAVAAQFANGSNAQKDRRRLALAPLMPNFAAQAAKGSMGNVLSIKGCLNARHSTVSLTKFVRLMHILADYPPPRSWEQFEELCADVFQSSWQDPAMVRHGRAG